MTKKDALRRYHGRDFDLIWRAVEKGYCTEDDLLFMIPNGWKRMHGFPVSRTFANRKSVAKRKRRRRILDIAYTQVIVEKFNSYLPKAIAKMWDGFVDISEVSMGDAIIFHEK